MTDPTLFHGISVIIDDEIDDTGSGIYKIQQQIQETGCFVVAMKDIPPSDALKNLRGANLFILDWNLHGGTTVEDGEVGAVGMPRSLRKTQIKEMINFLLALKSVRFAPVFIFTNEDVESVVRELEKYPNLYDSNEDSHIFIQGKHAVTEKGVFQVINEWLYARPSAYVLKHWERVYEIAKNSLFIDFYNKSVYWPLILWENFEKDSVPPSVELGRLIGRNLMSRMTPFDFDLDPFRKLYEEQVVKSAGYKGMLLRVLTGERFVSKDQLHEGSVSSGDVFKFRGDYYVNIRPECDCIARGEDEQNDVKLYLLKGAKVSKAQLKKAYSSDYGLIREEDTEAIVFALNGTDTVSFRFKELQVGSWGEWRERRIGRLLPPFLTKLKQRYSGYLDRPGLSRIPELALDIDIGSTAPTDLAPPSPPNADAGVQGNEGGTVSPAKVATIPPQSDGVQLSFKRAFPRLSRCFERLFTCLVAPAPRG